MDLLAYTDIIFIVIIDKVYIKKFNKQIKKSVVWEP